MAEANENLRAALTYAKRDWAVFPLHTTLPDGSCDCHRPECLNIGKHPRTLHGVNDAVTNVGTLERWWTMWPTANVGIACEPSGLVVIDIDPRHGGDESFRDLLERAPGLDDTVTSLTGGGGRHLFYRADPAKRISNGANVLGSGIDIRGTPGGYVVAPPSLHASGRQYTWERSAANFELAPFPDIMTPRAMNSAAPMVGSTIPAGERDQTLTSLAGTMRRRGMAEESILAALRIENKRCQPPMPDGDLQKIARSVARYEPGKDIPVSTGGNTSGITTYHRLRKQATKPPMYLLEVSGIDIHIPMDVLSSFGRLRKEIGTQADTWVPLMKATEWDATLAMLMETLETLPAPEDASEEGLIWSYVSRYLSREASDNEEDADHCPLLTATHIYTNGPQLRQALRQQNLLVDQRRIWEAVAAHGGQKRNEWMAGKQRWVWAIPTETIE